MKMTRLSALLTFRVWSLIGDKNWFLPGAACLPSPELTSSTTAQQKLFHFKELMGEGQITATTYDLRALPAVLAILNGLEAVSTLRQHRLILGKLVNTPWPT